MSQSRIRVTGISRMIHEPLEMPSENGERRFAPGLVSTYGSFAALDGSVTVLSDLAPDQVEWPEGIEPEMAVALGVIRVVSLAADGTGEWEAHTRLSLYKKPGE